MSYWFLICTGTIINLSSGPKVLTKPGTKLKVGDTITLQKHSATETASVQPMVSCVIKLIFHVKYILSIWTTSSKKIFLFFLPKCCFFGQLEQCQKSGFCGWGPGLGDPGQKGLNLPFMMSSTKITKSKTFQFLRI